ncbi:MAG TPA: Crp/Fnr family transcriptional regulator [Chloroflexota bacterium]|nr:Crp/Fnr family transcriptional regulator [Chloroflexota bacterium]
MPAANQTTAALADLLTNPALSESVRDLARRGSVRSDRKGTVLIEEGDRADVIYIVLAGQLRAYSTGAGDREITYGAYGPGEYLGEMGLDGEPRSASVVALTDCVCVAITRPILEAFIAERPGFAFELIAKVIRRARAATLSAKQLALNDVYGRLKHLLESGAVALPDGRLQFAEPITHKELASRLGCSREMVSRLLRDLERGGYLAQQDHRLIVERRLPPRW